MFRIFALLSALASVALAQSSSSSSAVPSSSTPNPLIPSSISTSCSSFLTTLNSDAGLKTCINALTSATSAFSPGNATPATKAAVTSALGNLCSDSVASACPENLIRSHITDFLIQCDDELTGNKNAQVIQQYDTLYALSPMRTSACSKDDSGSYCVLASPATSTAMAQLLSALYTNTGGSQSVVVPQLSTFESNNIPFLFYNSDLDATILCTTCLRQVLTAYMTFESNVVYGPGLSNSQLLDKQSGLYDAVKNKCPSGFMSGAVQAAGGLSSGSLSSAAFVAVPVPELQSTLFGLVLGIAGLAVTM